MQQLLFKPDGSLLTAYLSLGGYTPSVQKVPIPQASALRSKKHFAKIRSLHPPDAEHKGFGHSPTSILNLDFEKSDSKIASWYQLALLAGTMSSMKQK